MPTDAQRRARDKYNREKVVRKVVPLYPADANVSERIAEVGEPFATYVKRLIREDIERAGQ